MMIQKKIVILLFSTFTIIFLMKQMDKMHLKNQIYYYIRPRKGIQCYHMKGETLPEISDAEPIRRGESIFFHETSCNSFFNGKIVMTARQACAVESAALLNPNMDVYLLFASPGVFKFEGTESDRIIQALLQYSNVKIRHLNYEKYTVGTPLEDLYKTKSLDFSDYAQSHASDVLRYLTLWKYGGIYLDLDVIVIRKLETLPANFAGQESKENVAAGVLSFAPSGIGHEFAKRCVDALRYDFRGDEWGHNGPGVITRLLKEICGSKSAEEMVRSHCSGFKVYPVEKFYPIPWWNWTMYFDEKYSDAVEDHCRHSYAIHVWNKQSAETQIPVDAKAPYLTFARKYCPEVVKQLDEFF